MLNSDASGCPKGPRSSSRRKPLCVTMHTLSASVPCRSFLGCGKRRKVPTICIHDVGRPASHQHTHFAWRENPTGKLGKNMTSHCLITCKHVTTAEMQCLSWYLENMIFKENVPYKMFCIDQIISNAWFTTEQTHSLIHFCNYINILYTVRLRYWNNVPPNR